MGEFVIGYFMLLKFWNFILFLKCGIVCNCWTLYLSIDLKQHLKGDLPHIGMVVLWGGIKQGWRGFIEWYRHVGEFLKFCCCFLKGLCGPNCQILYLFMNPKKHPKGCLPHSGIVLLCWKIKQGWWVNLWVVMSCCCNFVLHFWSV